MDGSLLKSCRRWWAAEILYIKTYGIKPIVFFFFFFFFVVVLAGDTFQEPQQDFRALFSFQSWFVFGNQIERNSI